MNNAPRSPWTPERTERFKKLYADGLSFGKIAKELGGIISRNGLISKAHRLGLPGRKMPSSSAFPKRPLHGGQVVKVRDARTKSRSVPGMSQAPLPLPKEPPRPPNCAPVSLMNLGSYALPMQCRYPVSDVAGPATLFCGASSDPGPYCGFHRAIAYRGSREAA